jgi:threonine synthase
MTAAVALRCRVCEEVAPPQPADTCLRCDGPTDIVYDWPALRATVSRATLAAGPPSLWRYAALLPLGPADVAAPGWTPLVPAPRLSEALGIELLLKLETANPTGSFKDRLAALAAAAAAEYGLSTLCCASTGNLGVAVAATGFEAIVLAPADAPRAVAAAAARGAHVFAVDGTFDDCRRLELELAQLFPWGFLAGNLQPYANEGARTISFEIAEQLGWELPDAVVCAAASGGLLAKIAQGFSEVVRAGLADGAPPRLFGAQPDGCSPIARAYADDRPLSRVRPATSVRSLAVGDPAYGDLALGAARASGGDVLAVREEEIEGNAALLAETTGVDADPAAGVALGALVAAVRDGSIARGSRVVLVVTGAELPGHSPGVDPVEPDVRALLARFDLDG